MTEHVRGTADMFSHDAPSVAAIDPGDPKTWFLAQRSDADGWMGFSAASWDHALYLLKLSMQRVANSAENLVNLAAAVSAYYGCTSATVALDPYNIEAEALGAKMIYGPESLPTVDFREPFIANHADLAKLKAPDDWLSRHRVKFAFDCYRLSTQLGGVNGMYCSPFSLAVQLRSYPRLIRDMRSDPAFVHELLACLTDEILPSFLKAQKEYTGLDLSLGAAAWQSFPNVTTDMIEEFALPYDLKLMQTCMGFGMMAVQIGGADYCEETPSKFDKAILHKCFDVQTKLVGGQPSLILGMGRTQDLPIEWIVEYLDQFKAKGIRATMSVEINARVMRDGPPELIMEIIKRYIDNIARDHNLVMWGLTPPDTPPEHVHAAMAAARAYGKLPIADTLDEIQVVVPQRESFQEYVDKMSNGQGLQF